MPTAGGRYWWPRAQHVDVKSAARMLPVYNVTTQMPNWSKFPFLVAASECGFNARPMLYICSQCRRKSTDTMGTSAAC